MVGYANGSLYGNSEYHLQLILLIEQKDKATTTCTKVQCFENNGIEVRKHMASGHASEFQKQNTPPSQLNTYFKKKLGSQTEAQQVERVSHESLVLIYVKWAMIDVELLKNA